MQYKCFDGSKLEHILLLSYQEDNSLVLNFLDWNQAAGTGQNLICL